MTTDPDVEAVARALWLDRHPDTQPWPTELDRMNYMGHARAAIAADPGRKALIEALDILAGAADDVGVHYFDTDTMDPIVQKMQEATEIARVVLSRARGEKT